MSPWNSAGVCVCSRLTARKHEGLQSHCRQQHFKKDHASVTQRLIRSQKWHSHLVRSYLDGDRLLRYSFDNNGQRVRINSARGFLIRQRAADSPAWDAYNLRCTYFLENSTLVPFCGHLEEAFWMQETNTHIRSLGAPQPPPMAAPGDDSHFVWEQKQTRSKSTPRKLLPEDSAAWLPNHMTHRSRSEPMFVVLLEETKPTAAGALQLSHQWCRCVVTVK